MAMKEVDQVIKAARTGFLATTDGRRPTVRPMGDCAWVGGELWMSTALKSRKVEDLRKRPYVELCYLSKTGSHVRIAARGMVSVALRDKQRLFKLMPILKKYVTGPADPTFAVLRLRPDSVRLMRGFEMRYHEMLPAPHHRKGRGRAK